MAVAVNGRAEGPTIPASAGTLLRFQPGRKPDEPERADAPIWLLAGVSEKLRAVYRAALLARGIRNPSDEELVAALAFALEMARDGMAAEQFTKFASILERHQALPPLGEGESESFDRLALKGGLAMLYRTCRVAHPDLDALLTLRETWFAESMKVACAVALRGAEQFDGTVEVVNDEATAATLAQIPEPTQQAIGLWWLSQGALTEAQKKTSGFAPLSPTTPEITPPTSDAVPGPEAIAPSPVTKRGTKRLRSIPAS